MKTWFPLYTNLGANIMESSPISSFLVTLRADSRSPPMSCLLLALLGHIRTPNPAHIFFFRAWSLHSVTWNRLERHVYHPSSYTEEDLEKPFALPWALSHHQMLLNAASLWVATQGQEEAKPGHWLDLCLILALPLTSWEPGPDPISLFLSLFKESLLWIGKAHGCVTDVIVFNPHNKVMGQELILAPLNEWGNWGSESLITHPRMCTWQREELESCVEL